MNSVDKFTFFTSAFTAFVIFFGGSMIVVLVAGKPTPWQIATAAMLGAVGASKDMRSQLKLPPINGNGSNEPPTIGK